MNSQVFYAWQEPAIFMQAMKWLLGGLVLCLVGSALRRVLRLNHEEPRHRVGLIPLSADRDALYQPIALEVETQAAILGISLNDAMEERNSGHDEIAKRLVRLAASEWDRLAELVT